MNFLQKLFSKKEIRTIETVTVDDHLRQILGGITDVQTALNIPAVSACVDFIAGKIAELPIKLYREKDGKTTEITGDSRLYLLNDSTGDLLDPYQMKYAIVRDYLLTGTGYIFPERNGLDYVSLRYIESSQVAVSKNADPIYKIANYQIGTKTFPDHEIMRICRNTSNGVTGVGIIREHPEILNAAYKQIVYERYLVERGGNKKGFIQVDDRVTQEVLDDLKEKWKLLYSSDNNNMMVLNKGLKFVESSNTSVEMQLNESKDTNNELICQLFGLSAKVISGRASDEEYISAIKTAIMPIVAALQAALNKFMLLWSEKSDHYFILDTKELLKGDILKRYQAYQIALHEGFLQVDEVRYEEDKEPFNLNWIKLGLQDVLFDTKNHTIYTPNTNQTVKFGEFTVDNDNQGGIIETRDWATIKGKHVYIDSSGDKHYGENAYRVAKAESEDNSNLMDKDYDDISNMKGKMSDLDVRKWYNYHDKKIPNLIDTSLPIEQQARQACELRNKFRTQARNLMVNQKKRKELDITDPNKTFEELVVDKMSRKNLTKQQAIEDILFTATKTRKSVNKKLGLED